MFNNLLQGQRKTHCIFKAANLTEQDVACASRPPAREGSGKSWHWHWQGIPRRGHVLVDEHDRGTRAHIKNEVAYTKPLKRTLKRKGGVYSFAYDTRPHYLWAAGRWIRHTMDFGQPNHFHSQLPLADTLRSSILLKSGLKLPFSFSSLS